MTKVSAAEISAAAAVWRAEKTAQAAAHSQALARGDVRRRRAAGEAVCSLRELKDRLHYCHLDDTPCDVARAGGGRRRLCPYFHP